MKPKSSRISNPLEEFIPRVLRAPPFDGLRVVRKLEPQDPEGNRGAKTSFDGRRTEPRGMNFSARAEERASVRLSSPSKLGRGQQVSEYLKLKIRCPRPYVSLPFVALPLWGEGGLHRRKEDVRNWRFESPWHAGQNGGASRYKPVGSR